jgi:hypothetical protein
LESRDSLRQQFAAQHEFQSALARLAWVLDSKLGHVVADDD